MADTRNRGFRRDRQRPLRSRDVRLARGLARGWSEVEFDHREAAQTPLDVKRARADRVVDNSGSATATRRQVAQLWRQLVA